MVVLLQLKSKSGFAGFVSTSYIGTLVKEDKECFRLERVCAIYEVLNQTKTGDMNLVIKYYTNSLLSNGTIRLKQEDVLWRRDVDQEDEVLIGYRASIDGFRLDKLGIKRAQPSAVEAAPEMGRSN